MNNDFLVLELSSIGIVDHRHDPIDLCVIDFSEVEDDRRIRQIPLTDRIYINEMFT